MSLAISCLSLFRVPRCFVSLAVSCPSLFRVPRCFVSLAILCSLLSRVPYYYPLFHERIESIRLKVPYKSMPSNFGRESIRLKF